MKGLVEEVEWYRTVMAEHGYAGPAGDGVNPLREMLREKKGDPLGEQAEMTIALGAMFHAASLAAGRKPSSYDSINQAREFIAAARHELKR